MNYTYLPTSAYSTSPVIIMTTNPASKKTANLQANPHVSLLVHDWVSHRPPTTTRRLSGGDGNNHHHSPTRSSLASLLLDLNTSAMSSISATINGSARLVDPATDEDRFYRGVHLENNTFEGQDAGFNPFGQIAGAAGGSTTAAAAAAASGAEDGGRGCFVAGEEVRVIVVDIRDVRISDWKGNVKDWVLVPGDAAAAEAPTVNGAS